MTRMKEEAKRFAVEVVAAIAGVAGGVSGFVVIFTGVASAVQGVRSVLRTRLTRWHVRTERLVIAKVYLLGVENAAGDASNGALRRGRRGLAEAADA